MKERTRLHRQHGDPRKLTDAIVDAFYAHLLYKHQLARGTARIYTNDISHFKRWYEAVKESVRQPWFAASTESVQGFLDSHVRQNVSEYTINRRLRSLRRFFQWAQAQGLIRADPTVTLKSAVSHSARTVKPLSMKEIEALLSVSSRATDSTALRDRAIVTLMLETGMRLREVLSLRASDLQLGGPRYEARVIDPKSDTMRRVPLAPETRSLLETYIRDRCVGPNEYVFKSQRGSPLSPRAVQAMLQKLATSARIQNTQVTAHALRHTFATHFLKQHPSALLELSRILGIRSPAAAAQYHPAFRSIRRQSLKKKPVR